MGRYLLRRLLIAIPSLLGISVILFTVLALAPGDPFEELATNPAVPPEVRAALRAKFGLDDPVAVRYFRWIVGDAAGRLGLLVRQPHQCRHADPAAAARHAVRDRLGAAAGAPDRAAGRRLRGDAALLDLRPDRHRRSPSSASRCRPSSPGCCSSWSSACSSTGCRSSIGDIDATGWRWFWEQMRQSIMPICRARPRSRPPR